MSGKLKVIITILLIVLAGYITSIATLGLRWGDYTQENGIKVKYAGFPFPNTSYGYADEREVRGRTYKYPVANLRARELNAAIYSGLYGLVVVAFVVLRKKHQSRK